MLSPDRRPGRRPSRTLTCLLGAVALVTWSVFVTNGPVQAAPGSLFEIADGNVFDGAATAPDWGSMFGRTPTNTAGAPVSVVDAQGMEGPFFVEDPTVGSTLPNPPCDSGHTGDLTVLTGGGSDKNGDTLSTWTWTAGDAPAHKDDITNFYGAAQIDTNGHRVLYFGLERSGNKGNSHLDVEFLQAPMEPTITGDNAINGCPEGSFAGVRTVGDVLLILDYSGGGAALGEVRVWNGTSYELPLDILGNPVNLASIAGIAHNGAGAISCGDWNCRTATTVTPTLAAGTFLEGFLDFTGLRQGMGLPAPAATCFAAFNAKSRTASSWNSELKDIALADIDACDARITVGTSGVNEVGTNHTITGHVDTNANGAFVNAADGTTISFSKVGGPGSFVNGIDSCVTTGGTGSCSVAITSAVAGTTTVAASVSVLVGPTLVSRTTNGNAGPGGSGNAAKTWADGYIKVTPSAVSPVNVPHDFIVELGISHDAGTPRLTTVATPTIVPTVSPTPDGGVSHDCATPTSAGNDTWRCTVTINSSSPGLFTATATGQATVSGTGTPSSAQISRSTVSGSHGPGGNAGATKRYDDVAADIAVASSGTNEVGDPHIVAGTVHVDPSTGRVPAPDGTVIAFTLQSGPGSLSVPSCTTAGGTGSCNVTLTSGTAGVSVVEASSDITVSGRDFDLTTDSTGLNSGPITKRWVDASITVGPAAATNPLDEPHTFTVTVTAVPSGASPVTFGSITPVVTPVPGTLSSTCASPIVTGGTATCTVTINSSSAGVFTADATAVVNIGGVSLVRSTDDSVAQSGPSGSGSGVKTYVAGAIGSGGGELTRTDAGERLEVLGETAVRDTTARPGVARTGTDASTIVVFGAGLVIAGAALLGGSRRARPSRALRTRRDDRSRR